MCDQGLKIKDFLWIQSFDDGSDADADADAMLMGGRTHHFDSFPSQRTRGCHNSQQILGCQMESPNNHNSSTTTTNNKSSSKKRPRTTPGNQQRQRPPKIYLVVVESHQHVLEHIHAVLRKERLLTREWSMLHFDAHPDLACPNPTVPAKACFLPHEEFPVEGSTSSNVGATTDSATSSSSKENEKNASATSSEEHHTQPTLSQTKNLYELLDSTATGIAEWILPLVLAANLRRVHWIKSSTDDDNAAVSVNVAEKEACILRPPSQLPCGIHDYHVGVAIPYSTHEDASVLMSEEFYTSFLDLPQSATVKVDWPHPYYLEDDCTAHFGNSNREELFVLPKSLQLQVSSLGPTDNVQGDNVPPIISSSTSTAPNHQLWELDICLDYFACQNPFLVDLEAKDPVFSRALLEAVFSSRFYSSFLLSTPPSMAANTTISNPASKCAKSSNEEAVLQNYRQDVRQFWDDLVDLLVNSQQRQDGGDAAGKGNDAEAPNSTRVLIKGLEKYYAEPSKGQAYLQQLLSAFSTSLCHSTHDSTTGVEQELIAITRQALPNLSMPHHTFPSGKTKPGEPSKTNTPTTTTATTTTTTTNPAASQQRAISMETIRPALERVQREIETRYRGRDLASITADAVETSTEISTSSRQTPPFMITIARSANDGFTPSHLADELQETLIQHLHSLYCDCGKIVMRQGAEGENDTKVDSDGCRFQIIMDYGAWEGSSFF